MKNKLKSEYVIHRIANDGDGNSAHDVFMRQEPDFLGGSFHYSYDRIQPCLASLPMPSGLTPAA